MIYVVTTTELHQFAKVPALFEHYQDHKQQNNKLSLINFLIMHYGQADDKDGDSQKDRQLPFKSHEDCNNNITQVYVTFLAEHSVQLPFHAEIVSFGLYKEYFPSSAFLSAIWQPPKQC